MELDLGYLAQFVGMRFNELVLERAEAEGYGDLRHAHGYVFQHLIEGPRRITELAERMGVTQQAVSKSVAELVELGYLTSEVAGDRRARQIALSKRGHAAVAQARKTRARIEARVLAKHGAEVSRAKALLAAVLEELGGAEAVRSRRVREPR